MARKLKYAEAGYTLDRAVDDVFLRMPLWPWSALALIILGGIGGAGTSEKLRQLYPAYDPALRTAACAGYGVVAVALLLVMPRALRLVWLNVSLVRRPANDGGDRPWWPLRLLAAAVHLSPAGPVVHEQFMAAVGRAISFARSMLAYRLWPSCLAAFVAPVLGLLSAWEAGKQVMLGEGGNASDVFMRLVLQVSPPMVGTISVALGLMVVLAVIDQATKNLLLRWGTTMRLADVQAVACQRLIRGNLGSPPLEPVHDQPFQARPVVTGSVGLQSRAKDSPAADDIKRLLQEFPRGG